MKKTIAEKKTEVLMAAAFEELPQRLTCPKCKRSRTKGSFGLRVIARSAQGVPTRIARQSWCRDCRS